MMFRRIRGYLLQVVGLEFLDNRARDSFSSPALAKPGRRRRRIEVASRHSGLLRIDLMWFIANRAALTALKYWCMRCQKYSWLATRGSSRSHVWIVTTPSWNIWQRGRGGGGSRGFGRNAFTNERISLRLDHIFNSIEFIAKWRWYLRVEEETS